MKGLLVRNAYWHSPEYTHPHTRLQEELAAMGVALDIVDNNTLYATAATGKVNDWAQYDFCVFWDKDLYLLQAISQSGMRVYNSLDAVRICDDKMLTALALEKQGIPMPKTIAAPLFFGKKAPWDTALVEKAEATLSYPMIVKKVHGSLGEQVGLAIDREALAKLIDKMDDRYLLQEYMAYAKGSDIRVLVVGDKVLGAIRRQGNDFRSNAALGGSVTAYPLDKETKDLCLRIVDILGLDYCGIDLLADGKGGYVVCEVNSNAFFGAFERATGVNVARELAGYVVSKSRT